MVIHGAALLLAGGYVVFEGVVPRDSFVAVDALSMAQEDAEVLPEPSEELDPLPSAPMAPTLEMGGATTDEEVSNPLMLDVITAASAAGSFNLALPAAAVPNPHGIPGRGQKGNGGGGGGNASAKGAVRMLFNQAVEIKRLGVVVDRSSSMGPYLKVVFDEIGSKFSDATYVAVDGCGLLRHAWTMPLFKGKELKNGLEGALHFLRDPKTRQLDADYLFKASENGRLFMTVRDTSLPGFPKEWLNESGQYNSEARHYMVHPAFDLLIAEKVNAIYWFSDFTDKVEPELVREYAQKFKQAGVVLYMHHPLGLPDGPNSRSFPPQAVEAIELLHSRLARPTGGGMVRQALVESSNNK